MYQALWIVSFADEGQGATISEAVEDSNGFDAWTSWNSKARGLALLGAAATWPAFAMNSALQPQFLKPEEVFDETVKAKAIIREELKSCILLRCVGGQLKSYLSF